MASSTGGVKPFSLEGRLYRERERLTSMTDEERNFRRKYLKDQILSPDEPREVPEIYKELYNPIRRAYVIPLNAFGRMLTPLIGRDAAAFTRIVTGKFLMTLAVIYMGAYYFKYNAHDWTSKSGVRVVPSRPKCLPGDPGYPKISEKKVGAEYSSRGFENSPI